MLTFPNAKINIGLNIIEKRSDGFHNIESVFYPVGWCDALEIVPAESFRFQSSGLTIPGDEQGNLCIKAYQLLIDTGKLNHERQSSGGHPFSSYTSAFHTSQAIMFHLHKVIPMGAGLGGGSADGAFALKMLNEFYQLNLTINELQNLARQLGSDCAFFIENRPVYCFNKGDEFEDYGLDLKGKFIILVNPAIHISTAEAYAGVNPCKPAISLKEALQLPINQWKGIVKNDFEEKLLIKYPTIASTKESLYEKGALYASMTGSGSTVYGIFDKEIDLKDTFFSFAVWQGWLGS